MVNALLTIILLPIALGTIAVTAFWVAVAVKAARIHKERKQEEKLIQ